MPVVVPKAEGRSRVAESEVPVIDAVPLAVSEELEEIKNRAHNGWSKVICASEGLRSRASGPGLVSGRVQR